MQPIQRVTIGCLKTELSTPALCLDLDALDRNIRTMVDTCRRHGVQWRPHAKCHRSPVIARWLMAAGASGLTCATVGEAETMVAAGVDDVLIANMLAGRDKIDRLVELTAAARPLVCVDHIDQARAISQGLQRVGRSVRVLIELEIGMQRVGVLPGADALDLARQVCQLPGLQLAGVMAYEGHLLTVADPSEKRAAIQQALERVVACRQQIEDAGMPCPIVSCGGTGSFPISVAQPGITEIQAGGAIFMDAFYREACQIDQLEHALTVLATVVSCPTPERAVIDAGRKAMNIEIHRPRVLGKPGVTVDWLAAEHGVLKREPGAASLQVGEQLELIPGYADLTNVLHECFWGFRDGRLQEIIPIVRP